MGYYQTGLERNREAREKIVSALGGPAFCSGIPVVQLQPDDLEDYLKLNENYFSRGQWVVQGEDLAGRPFVVMRLIASRTGRTYWATAHPRYRETCVHPGFGDGRLWTLNVGNRPVQPNTDEVAAFIEKVRTGRHEEFSIAPKP